MKYSEDQIKDILENAPSGSQFYTDGYDVKYRKVIGDKYFGYLDEAKGWVETCDKQLSQERIDKGWWLPNLLKELENQMNIDKVETQSEHQEEMSALISANRMNESVDEFLAGLKDENEWNGEGLPTVGVECEIYCPVNPVMPDGDKDWMKTEIVAIIDCGFGAETTVVYKTPWSAQWYVDAHPSSALKFRKPETKQQREDRERLEAAIDLHDLAQDAYFADDGGSNGSATWDKAPDRVKNMYLAIVDKTNYRKGVK